MSEKIARYIGSVCGVGDNKRERWCLSFEVDALESRLAEAEAERLLAGKAICSALGICHDYALSIPKIVADLDAQTYRRFVEANKEDALSARVRELEEALRPVLDQRNIVVNGPMVVTLCLTRDEYNRAARALKGEG